MAQPAAEAEVTKMSKKLKIVDDVPFSLRPYDDKFMTLKSERLVEKENLMYAREQVFHMEADQKFSTFSDWVDFLNEQFANVSNVANHNCDIVMPSDTYDLTDFDDSSGTPTYDVVNSFNYQAKDYLMAATERNERLLPSFYVDALEELGSYSNAIVTEKQNFFKDFARIDQAGNTFRPIIEANSHRNIFFPPNYSYFLSNEKKNVFPIHNEITFNTIDRLVGKNNYGMPTPDEKGLFSSILTELDIFKSFIQNHDSANRSVRTFTLRRPDGSITFPTSTLELFSMLRNFTFSFDNSNNTFLNDTSLETLFSSNLKNIILLGKLRDICKVKNRTYHDILKLKECEYEFLFYKVEKRLDDANGEFLQRFIIPATGKTVNLIDTQININKTYSYNVKGYALIYGSSYTVTRISPRKIGDRYVATLVVETLPSFQIVEIPLFNKEVDTLQPAPLRPFVKFMNEINSKNKIKIYLDLSKGEEYSSIQTITTEDADYVSLIPRIRDREILYHFKYMKEPGEFEIFRTPDPPTYYSDFETSRLGTFANPMGSTSMVFHDYIAPNKKYYYTFRALNGFGVYSNPTAIYEVELLKDADDSRLNVKIHHLNPPEPGQKSITFKDFFQIEPATQQRVYIPPTRLSPNDLDAVGLGIAEKKIWGKKFKIRLKSKATGKKMDFNVLFNLVTEKSEENFG